MKRVKLMFKCCKKCQVGKLANLISKLNFYSVLVRPLLKVQREPGVRPVTGSRRVYPSCPWVYLYGNYPGDG